MFHSRNLNNMINRIQKQALRLVCKNNSSFSEFLSFSDSDNSATVRHKNLHVLVTEICKVKNGIAPEIIKYALELKNPLNNLR